ncbi:MAG: DUF362 domain-containing protein [Candidatus Thorarchaeota archaeon]|jgi:uncharacterized protein (DUF362 family)
MASNVFMENGKHLVGKTRVSGNLKKTIKHAVDLIGGFEKVIQPGDKVTLKPNLNTADPYPASSSSDFIKDLGELILDAGAEKLRLVESSTLRVAARGVAEKIGMMNVAEELDAEFVFLDEHEWVKVKFPRGKYLKAGSLGKPIVDSGKLVLAPNLKTHALARYTGAMKLFVGWIKGTDRMKMHVRRLEPKVVDLASYFNPSLIVMDSRECFVTGGPASGTVECTETILTSGDMVAIDVEGVRILQSYGAKNKLGMDVWDVPQIKHAVELGIGAKSDDEIKVIEAA